MKKILILLAIPLLGAGCTFLAEEEWMGFYYPEGHLGNESEWIIESGFSSFDECYDWAYDVALVNNHSGEDLFECGVSCELNPSLLVRVCDETLDEDLPLASTISPERENEIKGMLEEIQDELKELESANKAMELELIKNQYINNVGDTWDLFDAIYLSSENTPYLLCPNIISSQYERNNVFWKIADKYATLQQEYGEYRTTIEYIDGNLNSLLRSLLLIENNCYVAGYSIPYSPFDYD